MLNVRSTYAADTVGEPVKLKGRSKGVGATKSTETYYNSRVGTIGQGVIIVVRERRKRERKEREREK